MSARPEGDPMRFVTYAIPYDAQDVVCMYDAETEPGFFADCDAERVPRWEELGATWKPDAPKHPCDIPPPSGEWVWPEGWTAGGIDGFYLVNEPPTENVDFGWAHRSEVEARWFVWCCQIAAAIEAEGAAVER